VEDALAFRGGVAQPMLDVPSCLASDRRNVTLSGTVRSFAEKQEAVRSAWLAPGVVSVDDQLAITN
jgi:hypothetical protein